MAQAGQRFGRYELVAPLGKGGMGEVWEARLVGAHEFRRQVAVKLLPAGGSVEAREALVREARMGGMLQHPNVVATTDLLFEDGQAVVVMELCAGPTLSALVRSGAVTAGVALEVGVQCAAGLVEIHRLGMLHRDVKPSNVIVDRFGTAKLLDLGIARFVGQHGIAAGTLAFMAPEQARGTEDVRADVWSLGATIGSAALGVALLGRDGRRVDPAHLARLDAVLDGLGELVGRCLAREPSGRPADCGELGAAFAKLRSGVRGDPFAELRKNLPAPRPQAGTTDATSLRTPGNLPRPRNPLLGRDAAVAEVAELLRAGTPVTLLVGPGGAGKTRLSIAAATAARTAFASAWFVDVTEARSADEVRGRVAEVLSIREPDVGRALADRGRVLVVLDNLEQVAAPAAALVARWLDQAPDAVFLGTSRVRLGIDERRVEVEPLGPAAARALFFARAGALPGAEPALVDAIVAKLEGSPLAIELAASRTRVLSLPTLLAALDDRLRLLATEDPSRPPRQRSVLAAVTGSLELLAPDARRLLARASVFRSGFDLSAAEAVAGVAGGRWVVDLLAELGDHSLVRFNPALDRFSMFESIREVAARELAEHDAADAESRHAAHYGRLADALRRELRAGGPETLARMDREADNFAAAVERGPARGEAVAALAALVAGRLAREGAADKERWRALGVALADRATGDVRLGALVQTSNVCVLMGRYDEARTLAEVALSEAPGTAWLSRAQLALAECGRPAGPEHLALAAEAIAIERSDPDPDRLAALLVRASSIAIGLEELAEAKAWLEEGRALWAARGSRASLRQSAAHLAHLHQLRGDLDAAIAVLSGDEEPYSGSGRAATRLGILFEDALRPADAEAAYRRALRDGADQHDGVGVADALVNLGILLARCGRLAEADEAWAQTRSGREARDLHARIEIDRWAERGLRAPTAEALAGLSAAIDHYRAIGHRGLAFALGRRLALVTLTGPLEEVAAIAEALPDAIAAPRARAFFTLGRTDDAARSLAASPAGNAEELGRLAARLGPPLAREAVLRELAARHAPFESELLLTLFDLHEIGADVRGQLGALATRSGAPTARFAALCAAAEHDRTERRGALLAEAEALAAPWIRGEGRLWRWLARARSA